MQANRFCIQSIEEKWCCEGRIMDTDYACDVPDGGEETLTLDLFRRGFRVIRRFILVRQYCTGVVQIDSSCGCDRA
jgi:hypothetical protein